MTSSFSRQSWLAWFAVIAGSAAPEVIFVGRFPVGPLHWLFLSKMTLLAGLWLLGFKIRWIGPLRSLLFVLLCLHVSFGGFSALVSTPIWKQWIGAFGSPFTRMMVTVQVVRIGVAATVIFALLATCRADTRLFLRKGALRAPVQGIRWPSARSSWLTVGWILTITLSLGTLAFMVASTRGVPMNFTRALPLLPLVFLFSLTNSAGEEVTYRLGLLCPALEALGPRQAAAMSAVYFGLAHYYGVPAGAVGVIMASILGWIASRAVIDTGGLGWAVLIHFVQDVWIFLFLGAIFSVVR